MRYKTVFLTDADNRMSSAVIKKLQESCNRLILNSKSNGHQIADLIRGTDAIVCNVDLKSFKNTNEIIKKFKSEGITIDVVIHNNQSVINCSIENCTEDIFEREIGENLKTAYVTAATIGKMMCDAKSGKFIFISTIHDEKPTGSCFLYSISKGALKMFAKECALKFGPDNVSVNIIQMCPIEEDKEIFKSGYSFIYENYEKKVLNKRLCTYEELANLVDFIGGDDCGYLNGAEIRLDGGFTLYYLDNPADSRLEDLK